MFIKHIYVLDSSEALYARVRQYGPTPASFVFTQPVTAVTQDHFYSIKLILSMQLRTMKGHTRCTQFDDSTRPI